MAAAECLRAVGPKGHVSAADLSEAMVEQAKQRLGSAPNIIFAVITIDFRPGCLCLTVLDDAGPPRRNNDFVTELVQLGESAWPQDTSTTIMAGAATCTGPPTSAQ